MTLENHIEVFDLSSLPPADAWAKIEPFMQVAVEKYCSPKYVDGNLLFHKLALIGSYRAGFNRIKYIRVGDGMLGLGTSGKELEHWFFIGALFNCNTELPCSSDQFKEALAYMPCCQTSMLSPRMQEKCVLNTYDDGGTFAVQDLESYIKNAPYKQRGDWGRLLRKAKAAGMRVEHHIDWEAVELLTPGYLDYWRSKHDSYLNEDVMVLNYLDMFQRFPEFTMGLTIYLNDIPVAVNMSWGKDDTVHDMLCIRNMSDDLRSFNFGILAVLLNVGFASELGLSWYSLCSGDQQYKKQFLYGTPSTYQCVNVLSHLDVVLRNGQAGYVDGEYCSKERVLELSDSYPKDAFDKIVAEYPFVIGALEQRMKEVASGGN